MVGRLVQQQQVGVGEQRGGQRHAHPPAAGKRRHRARLLRLVETKAGQDGGGARRGGVGADGAQPLVHLGQPVRLGGLRLRQQGQTLLVALQHGFQQARIARGRLLLHLRHAGAGGEADLAAVDRHIAGDGLEQGGLARAVAPHQADAPAGVHGQVGVVQQ